VPNLAKKEVLKLSDARSALVYKGAGGNEEPTNIQLDVRKLLAEHRSALIARGIHPRGCTAMNRWYRPVVSELNGRRVRMDGTHKTFRRRNSSSFGNEHVSYSSKSEQEYSEEDEEDSVKKYQIAGLSPCAPYRNASATQAMQTRVCADHERDSCVARCRIEVFR
jgi:hypothetical protein